MYQEMHQDGLDVSDTMKMLWNAYFVLKDLCIKEKHQNGLDVLDTKKVLRQGVLDRTDIGEYLRNALWDSIEKMATKLLQNVILSD